MAITVEVVSTNKGFEQLKGQWDGLLSVHSEGNIFLEHDWLYTWWRHFGHEGALFILLVRREGALVAIAPFMKVRRLGFTCLEFIGSLVSDFQGIICVAGEEESACRALADLLCRGRHVDLWRIRRFKEDGRMHRGARSIMNDRTGRHWSRIRRHQERVPFLDLSRGWDDLVKGLRTKFISDTNRLEKKLAREHGFQIEDIGVDDLSEKIRAIYAMSRQNKAQQDVLDGRKVEFLQDVAKKFKERGWLSLKALFSGGKLAAAHFGFIYGHRYYYYLPAFDSAFRAYGAGRILLRALIQSAFEKNLEVFDLMLGEEPYKLEWAPQFVSVYSCHVAPRTLRGAAAFFLFDRLIPWIKERQGVAW